MCLGLALRTTTLLFHSSVLISTITSTSSFRSCQQARRSPRPSTMVTEFVDNNTGTDWSGYNMFLGFGTGAGFTLSPPGDGLDFDFPLYTPPPTSPVFGTITPGPSGDSLSFSGGTHGSGGATVSIPDRRPRLGILSRVSPLSRCGRYQCQCPNRTRSRCLPWRWLDSLAIVGVAKSVRR